MSLSAQKREERRLTESQVLEAEREIAHTEETLAQQSAEVQESIGRARKTLEALQSNLMRILESSETRMEEVALSHEVDGIVLPSVDLHGERRRALSARMQSIETRIRVAEHIERALRENRIDLALAREQIETCATQLDELQRQPTAPQPGLETIEPLSDQPDLGAPKHSSSERRHQLRKTFQAAIDWQSAHNFFSGFSADLSEGGLFVATEEIPPIGTAVTLAFSLPDGTRVDCAGEVRWSREGRTDQLDVFSGIGIQFLELPAEAEAAIKAFMAQRDPLFFDLESLQSPASVQLGAPLLVPGSPIEGGQLDRLSSATEAEKRELLQRCLGRESDEAETSASFTRFKGTSWRWGMAVAGGAIGLAAALTYTATPPSSVSAGPPEQPASHADTLVPATSVSDVPTGKKTVPGAEELSIESRIESHFSAGNAHLAAGHPEAALREYQKVLVLNKDNADAHRAAGIIHVQLGHVEQAITSFDAYLRAAPDSSEAEAVEELIARLEAEVDEESSEVPSADADTIDIETESPGPGSDDSQKPEGDFQKHLNRGHQLLEEEDVEDAISAYQEAAALEPQAAAVHRALGIAYTMLEKPEQAIREYRLYLKLAPHAEEAGQIRQIIATLEGEVL